MKLVIFTRVKEICSHVARNISSGEGTSQSNYTLTDSRPLVAILA